MVNITKAREALSSLVNTISENNLLDYRDEIDLLSEFIEDADDYFYRSVSWNVADFEGVAKDREGDYWDSVYDPDKFEDALYKMIDRHDAELGITWFTVGYYLDEECKRDEIEEDEVVDDLVIKNAGDEICVGCGSQADVFWPVNIDPDIQALPYCDSCVELEEEKLREALINITLEEKGEDN